jgi:hypothetical protein
MVNARWEEQHGSTEINNIAILVIGYGRNAEILVCICPLLLVTSSGRLQLAAIAFVHAEESEEDKCQRLLDAFSVGSRGKTAQGSRDLVALFLERSWPIR